MVFHLSFGSVHTYSLRTEDSDAPPNCPIKAAQQEACQNGGQQTDEPCQQISERAIRGLPHVAGGQLWRRCKYRSQRLPEHSSPQLTSDVYTNVDLVLREAVGQLPVADWLW